MNDGSSCRNSAIKVVGNQAKICVCVCVWCVCVCVWGGVSIVTERVHYLEYIGEVLGEDVGGAVECLQIVHQILHSVIGQSRTREREGRH